jgi:hypothetical protein
MPRVREAVLGKLQTSTTTFGSPKNFPAITTVYRGSARLSSNTYCNGFPLRLLGVDLFEGKVKPFFPLCVMMRVLADQGSAHGDRQAHRQMRRFGQAPAWRQEPPNLLQERPTW